MKARFLSIISMIILVLTFTFCKKKEDVAPAKISFMTLSINDTLYKADSTRYLTNDTNNFLVGYMPNSYIVGISLPKKVGTYPTGITKRYFFSYAKDSLNSFVTMFADSIGQMTFTELSPSVVKGTFSGQVTSPYEPFGTKMVKNGSFEWYLKK